MASSSDIDIGTEGVSTQEGKQSNGKYKESLDFTAEPGDGDKYGGDKLGPDRAGNRNAAESTRVETNADRRRELGTGRRSGLGTEHFGVPADYVERPGDYAPEVTFRRQRGSEQGKLSVTRGLSHLEVDAHSGINETGFRAAPSGTYDLLAGRLVEVNGVREPFNVRLEMVGDSRYGDDEASNGAQMLRLHGPGERGVSIGCVTVGKRNGDVTTEAQEDWKRVKRLVLVQAGEQKMARLISVIKLRYLINDPALLGLREPEDVAYFGKMLITEE